MIVTFVWFSKLLCFRGWCSMIFELKRLWSTKSIENSGSQVSLRGNGTANISCNWWKEDTDKVGCDKIKKPFWSNLQFGSLLGLSHSPEARSLSRTKVPTRASRALWPLMGSLSTFENVVLVRVRTHIVVSTSSSAGWRALFMSIVSTSRLDKRNSGLELWRTREV